MLYCCGWLVWSKVKFLELGTSIDYGTKNSLRVNRDRCAAVFRHHIRMVNRRPRNGAIRRNQTIDNRCNDVCPGVLDSLLHNEETQDHSSTV